MSQSSFSELELSGDYFSCYQGSFPYIGIPDAPHFKNGCQNPDIWLEEYEDYVELYHWTDSMKLRYINLYADAPHKDWVRRLARRDGMCWEKFKTEFRKEGCARLGLSTARLFSLLTTIRMGMNEELRDFIARFEALLIPLGDAVSELNKKRFFLSGLEGNLQDMVLHEMFLQQLEENATYQEVSAISLEVDKYFKLKENLIIGSGNQAEGLVAGPTSDETSFSKDEVVSHGLEEVIPEDIVRRQ